jgi:hypothetical protein
MSNSGFFDRLAIYSLFDPGRSRKPFRKSGYRSEAKETFRVILLFPTYASTYYGGFTATERREWSRKLWIPRRNLFKSWLGKQLRAVYRSHFQSVITNFWSYIEGTVVGLLFTPNSPLNPPMINSIPDLPRNLLDF